MRLLFSCHLLFLFCSAADPLEQLVTNFAQSIRTLGERWFASVSIPTVNDVDPRVSFSMDDKTVDALSSLGNFLNTCPSYLPMPILDGTWHVIFLSQRLLEGPLNSVDEAIDRLSSNRPLPRRRMLSSLFRQGLQLSCAQITFLTSGGSFEWAYTNRDGLPRSIIGRMAVNVDRSFVISFAPSVDIEMAISSSSTDLLVFSQLDVFPKCDNHMVLSRDRRLDFSELLNKLTIQGANLPSNPLVAISCQSTISPVHRVTVPPPIDTSSDGRPFVEMAGGSF